ncbi:Lrp/AsnC family transcriptional regulator [Aestuariispira insulae]|uniref:AsnC family transcriptional regulator n=1 Tax=Aestuariispira insulae TaxID=1461337 RepID=A0A3D9H1L2_9PROT|nr:Lrp/AsnC family transcriptional regulator [Aestuariispira insulae]RED43390.1 AsnC family transcriptional regulator [Aestuariispira insulae]
MKLDRLDLKILKIMQENGRITKLRLAEKINLSPTASWERLRKLEQSGVIESYHARLNLEKVVKLIDVLVHITLKRHRQEDFSIFENRIRQIPEITECQATGGGMDYLMKVTVPDIVSYQSLMDDLLQAEIGIDRYFTYVVTKSIKPAVSPLLDRLHSFLEEF